MQKKRKVIILMLLLATLSVPVSFPTAVAEESTVFSEQFDGTALDASKWEFFQQGTPKTPFEPYGGYMQVAEGSLHMSSTGSTFPFIRTLQNPFPAVGDFAVEFNLTYSAMGDYGDGLMIGNGTPTNEPYGWRNRIFTLWAADKGTPNDCRIYIELFNKFVYEIDYQGYRPNTPMHSYRIAYTQGVYHVSVDGTEVAQAQSDIRPTTIVIGHPPSFELPHTGVSTSMALQMGGWSSFDLDYITVSAAEPTKLSISASVQNPQVGSKVTLYGNLSGSGGEPIGNQTVDILYSIAGLQNWYPLAAAITDSAGTFATMWVPTASGNFNLRAVWNGNDEYAGASVEKDVSIFADSNNTEFFAESNSTLSSLSYNATSREIAFTVSGPSGTSGYVKFVISKILLPTLDDFRVYLDGEQINFTAASVGDSQVLYFEYHHSSHLITMRMPVQVTPELSSWVLLLLLAGLGFVAVAVKKKTNVLSR